MRSQIIIKLPDEYPRFKNSKFAGRRIVKRSPYFMPGELVVPASTSGRDFADGTFTHNADYPFEVTAMMPFITTLDVNGLPQNDPGIGSLRNLYRFVQLQMKFVGIVRDMTKSAQRLSSMTDLGVAVHFDAPIYLETSQGFAVTVNNFITAADAAGGIRMEISFLGSILEVE